MGSFAARDSRFIYTDETGDQVLVDYNDFYRNKSRIPFHSITGDRTVPDLIMQLMDACEGLSVGSPEEGLLLEYTLFDILFSTFIAGFREPARVVEIGCQNGILSYHLGTILGAFNNSSVLYCMNNTIGGGSEDLWIDLVGQIKEEDLPDVRFAACDYEQTFFQEETFDAVVIGAYQSLENPEKVLPEMKRIVKPGGVVFCFLDPSDWLLYDMFYWTFPESIDYSVGRRRILLSRKI